jgi:hypothetical protein
MRSPTSCAPCRCFAVPATPCGRTRIAYARAEVYLTFGATGRAAADYARAEDLFAATGQEFEYAMARHNRGLTAIVRGDLPAP